MIKIIEIKEFFNKNNLLSNLILGAVFVFVFFILFYGFFTLFGHNAILYFVLAVVFGALIFLLFWLATFHPDIYLILGLILIFNPYNIYITITQDWEGTIVRASISVAFLLIFFIATLLKGLLKKKLSRVKTPIDKLLILFLIFPLIGIAYGFFQGYSPRIIIADSFPILEFTAFFFLTTFIIKNEKQAQGIIFGLIAWLILIGIGEIIFYFLGGYYQLSQQRTLGGMIIKRLTDFMAIIALSLLMALYLCPGSIKKKKLLILLSFIPLIVLILGFFRSLWLGVLAALIFILLMVGKYKQCLRTLIFSLIILGIILLGTNFFIAPRIFQGKSIFPMIFEGIISILPSSEKAKTGIEPFNRLYYDQLFLSKIYESPIIGKGLGNEDIGAPTNYYLEIAYKMGIPALLFFLWIFFVFFKKAILIFKSTKFGLNKGLRLGILSAFVANAIVIIAFPALSHFPIMVYLGVMGASFFSLKPSL